MSAAAATAMATATSTGAARKARERKARAQARHVRWLVTGFQALDAHHTRAFGSGEEVVAAIRRELVELREEVAALRSAKTEEPLARAAEAESEAAAGSSSVDAGRVRNEIAMETPENFPGIKVGESDKSQKSRVKRRADATSKEVGKHVKRAE